MKHLPLWLLTGVVLILAGGLATHFSGEFGSLHLRNHTQANTFVLENGTEVPLPFSVRLEEFTITYYPGTTMPKDYSSRLTLLPGNEEKTISMNHILRHRGYRFLQADYDHDLQGSILMVCHDPWGIPVTYAGYLLLLVSMAGYFLRKGSVMRTAIHELPAIPRLLKYTLLTLAILLLAGCFYLICRKLLYEPLMPVLRSPMLWIHVLIIVTSYALLALVAIIGIFGLVLRSKEKTARLQTISLVTLHPAVFLLATGIIVGAVWAGISWGRYWSWDPKETWALVTFLVYSIGLHSRQLKPLQHPRVFHGFCVIAFLFVLITWFGVNLILGGMHSYA